MPGPSPYCCHQLAHLISLIGWPKLGKSSSSFCPLSSSSYASPQHVCIVIGCAATGTSQKGCFFSSCFFFIICYITACLHYVSPSPEEWEAMFLDLQHPLSCSSFIDVAVRDCQLRRISKPLTRMFRTDCFGGTRLASHVPSSS